MPGGKSRQEEQFPFNLSFKKKSSAVIKIFGIFITAGRISIEKLIAIGWEVLTDLHFI